MTKNCFYIPTINLMHVKLNDSIKSLCFGITRGYFETETLEDMLTVVDYLEQTEIKTIDNIDKIKMNDGTIVYRQRLYFVSLEDIVTVCKKFNFGFNLTDDISISNSSDMNIRKDMVFLEVYANQLNMSVEDWLILVFRYYCVIYLKYKDLMDLSSIDEDFFAKIKTIHGLLNRAPYFLSICNIAKHKFVVLQYFDIENEHLYTIGDNCTTSFFNYGFTNLTVLQDTKRGIFVKG